MAFRSGHPNRRDFDDRYAKPQWFDQGLEEEGVPELLPLNRLDHLRGEYPVGIGHIRETRTVQQREQALEDPIAFQLDLRVASERTTLDPARCRDNARRVLL